MNPLSIHREFWQKQPALLFAICLLIGTSSFLYWEAPCNWLWPLLWSAYLITIDKSKGIVLILAGVLYCFCLYPKAPSGNRGLFSIASLQPHHSPFQKSLVYKGSLSIDGQTVPCSIFHSGKNHPPANCNYYLEGKLVQRGPHNYLFKASHWQAVDKTWSIAEFRYQIKEQFRKFLSKKMKSAPFLGALITGDVEERTLRYEFGRLGLQHILAISGFHFAILIAFCSFFIGLFLPFRAKIILLLLIINLYFIFVGALPAVQRSWITALFYLIGKLIGRHSSGLNILGVSLLIELIYNPLASSSLGFQLSFLSCSGILLLKPLFDKPLQYLLPRRNPFSLNTISQHGYLMLSFIRQGITIMLAVNVAILPLLLYHFHKFPLLSLFYNLFFPFLVGISLFSLLIALLLFFLFPPLGNIFFKITDSFTLQILELISYPPIKLDYSLTVTSLPAWIIPLYLFGLFCLTNTPISSKILSSYGGRSSVG